MSLSNAKITSREPLPEKEAAWTRLVRINYQDPNGKARTWESVERTTRREGSDIDAVGIIAILNKSTCPEIVLQKQFRAPLGKVTIEIPAGLIDPGESAADCAVRELKEETGYVGVVPEDTSTAISTVLFNDPGICNTNLRVVHLDVDTALPENQNPVPQLEDDEFIEVFRVPLAGLWDACRRLESEGCAIDARVGTLAEGIQLSKALRL